MTQEEKLLKIAQSLHMGFFYKRDRIKRVYINRWAKLPHLSISCYIEAVNNDIRVVTSITNTQKPREWSEIRESILKNEIELEIKTLNL